MTQREPDPGAERAATTAFARAAALVAVLAVLALLAILATTGEDEPTGVEISEVVPDDPGPGAAQSQTEAVAANGKAPSDPQREEDLLWARLAEDGIDEDSEQFRNRVELISLSRDRSEEGKARRRELILWFLRNHPDDEVLTHWGQLHPKIDGAAWSEAVALFEAAVAREDVPTGALANYAHWTTVPNRSKALELYGRLQQREPGNSRWLKQEAQLYMMDISRGTLGDPDTQAGAALALEAFTSALELSEDATRGRLLAKAIEAAALAGDAELAESWARELLAISGDDPSAYHARHNGHQGMGLAALVRGDTDGAVAELLQMGDVPPGAVQRSFGPRMRLANELLARGEREAVIQYLEKVATFWKPEGVAAWIERLRAGETFQLNRFSIRG